MKELSKIEYASILAGLKQTHAGEALVSALLETLPNSWRDAYNRTTGRPTDLVIVRHNTFQYLYDHFPVLQPTGTPFVDDPSIEPRMVAAFGCSAPHNNARDDYRLKGWVGDTETAFGKLWDKGHFIANSISGMVDGTELNVYVQLRRLNRGWSTEGKMYRKMEAFCKLNPGTFCFSRPLYEDQSAKPAWIEFGLLKPTIEFWIATFDNKEPVEMAKILNPSLNL